MMPDRLPPRPPAKAEIFVEGDHVVYPTHGVGKVERIATEEIAGHKLELIHITFEENRMTLRVPVAKARSAGLRKLATRKLFDEALAVLKGRARIKRTMWSRRAQEYEAKINSGDPLAIAEVVRDLHRNAGQPDQSFSERQIYEAAMDRLAAELAALDKTDKADRGDQADEFPQDGVDLSIVMAGPVPVTCCGRRPRFLGHARLAMTRAGSPARHASPENRSGSL